MHTVRAMLVLSIGAFVGCSDEPADPTDDTDTGEVDSDSATDTDSETPDSGTYMAEVWVDNWSSMYVNGDLVMEDSVSITTERSFNAETFTFEAEPPFLITTVLKDFIEDDSGLEYIGSTRQQIGDGGYIAQITHEASNDVVLTTSSDWRCLTIHDAPLNTECESDPNPLQTCLSDISSEPSGWHDADFDDSGWEAATVYTANAVDPKEEYEDITWVDEAEFIWGPDLQTNNTVLCRVWVGQ